MPQPTYTPLATVTLGTTAASVTFSSIPATYRDLIFVIQGGLSSIDNILSRYNGDTGSNYSFVLMRGNGSNAASSSGTLSSAPVWYTGNPQNGMAIIQIMDYSATDKHKTALVRDDTNNNTTNAMATRWANTNAITSIQLFTGTFNAGFTFSLYGIAS